MPVVAFVQVLLLLRITSKSNIAELFVGTTVGRGGGVVGDGDGVGVGTAVGGRGAGEGEGEGADVGTTFGGEGTEGGAGAVAFSLPPPYPPYVWLLSPFCAKIGKTLKRRRKKATIPLFLLIMM